MPMDTDQIALLKQVLAQLDSAIFQAESSLRTATDPQDITGLTAQLVELRSERFRTQAELDNLEAAAVLVAAPAAAAGLAMPAATPRGVMAHSASTLKSLKKEVAAIATDRQVI